MSTANDADSLASPFLDVRGSSTRRRGAKMPDLKSCPFCGGNAIASSSEDAFGRPSAFVVSCTRCGARIPPSKTARISRLVWNKRKTEAN